MKVTALAGGVGGAKLIKGLSNVLPPDDLTVIVNTADDFWFHGLYVSPDVDTVIYNLAGINHPEQGWGRDEESFTFITEFATLGEEPWFQIGDRDLATHILRTDFLHQSKSLTAITKTLCERRGIQVTVLPMCDHPVRTIVKTMEFGELPFQEYFVKHSFEPKIKSLRFEGIKNTEVTLEAVKRITESDLVVICPSNPFVSIDPILAVNGMRELIKQKAVVAVSPIIGGKAVKGPASKMFTELGLCPSSFSIAKHYREILHGLVIDSKDEDEKADIERCGIILLVTDTLMSDDASKTRLAQEVIDFGKEVLQAKQV
jgi:LPPG:FO 2-phospho-L-lactate transferase